MGCHSMKCSLLEIIIKANSSRGALPIPQPSRNAAQSHTSYYCTRARTIYLLL